MPAVRPPPPDLLQALGGIDAHPHARAVLGPALAPGGAPAHAYLFHGPPGTGKRTAARAFAAALLADGARDPDTVTGRVQRGVHPDLSWVTPSGAAEMLVGDIDEPVVAAATRTPFESKRRVFVIEAVQRLNDQAANKLLKTLEEPPWFVHLILLADRREDVLPTIASRCQQVRFDPLPSVRIEQRLGTRPSEAGGEGAMEAGLAAACSRLALGDARLAAHLASEAGQALRASSEGFVRSAMTGRTGERSWMGLLQAAKAAGVSAGEEVLQQLEREAELLPGKERKKHQRDGDEARRRAERRARTETLDLGLGLAELWLRDVWCMAEGAPELVHAVDRRPELEHDLQGRDAPSLRGGVELVRDTRMRLPLNVSEQLALEALSYRLAELLA